MTEPRGWTYDQRLNNGRGAYRDSVTGRVISQQQATFLIDQAIDRTQTEITTQINYLLDNGQISVADWQKAMSETIKDAYIQQAELAAGGRENMTQAMWGSLSTPLQEQYKYLSNFAKEIADGKLSIGQIQMRSKMYINSSREVYWRVKDRQMKAQGLKQEKWDAIGDDSTCGPCAEADAMGWQPLGTFAQPGSGNVLRSPLTHCQGLTSCRCQKRYQ